MAGSVNRLKLERISGRDLLDPAFRARVQYVAVSAKTIPAPVRWSFLIFAFALPFQSADLPFMSGTFARIFGFLFFVTYCFYYNPLIFQERSFPRVPAAMWWLAAFVAIYALSGYFVSEEAFYDFRSRLVTLVQLIVLFWFASDLLKNEKIAINFLMVFSIAATGVALGSVLQIPGFSETTMGTNERTTVLGFNPNYLGGLMALAAVMLVGLCLNVIFKRFNLLSKMLLIAMILPLLTMMIGTGSRGSILAFMAGCFVYSAPFWKSKRKWAAIVLVLLCSIVLVYVAVNNPVLSERMQQSYYEGNLAGRERIFPEAIEMILERPIFGWHPAELDFDPHSLFLHLLLEVGMVGALPFCVGLWLCGRAAWKARLGNLGLLPIALLATLLVANMSGTGLLAKETWLALTLAVAAESTLARRSRKGVPVVLKNVPLSTHA
jgi:O-antigen ligase